MINKIYKSINNKYSILFKFLFFIRYLFVIFFIAAVLFLSIPHFFNYKKIDIVLKNYLLESYGIELSKYESINFNSFPLPNLEVIEASFNLKDNTIKLNTKNVKIFPRLVNIYNYDNYQAKKVVFNKNEIFLQIDELKILGKFLYKIMNKFTFNDLELKILDKNEALMNLKKVSFSNYGYKKNTIKGEVFNKLFKIKSNDNLENINFKLFDTGTNINLKFYDNNNSFFKGLAKIKILKSNLKFNFEFDNEKLKIYNSYFRSKDISLNNVSTINYKPFFDINSIINVDDISPKLFKNFEINKIFSYREIIKKINSKNIVNFESKKLNLNLIDNSNSKIDLAYGRLSFSKNFQLLDSNINCKGNSNLIIEYPILYFDCIITSEDKRKLLKKFSINYQKKNKKLNLKVKGNLNFLNKKINFNTIRLDKNYNASKEDLIYFKNTFEIILFDDKFVNIFELDKFRKFFKEIF
jgi:hypothetical protein